MALDKQKAPLSFRGGIDHKTDAFQVVPGKLLTLENATFQSPGRLLKRNGYDALPRTIANSDDASATRLTQGAALGVLKDELLAFDGRSVFSRNDAGDDWVWKGVMPSCVISKSPVSNTNDTVTAQDGVTHSTGTQAYVWETASGISYCLVDSTTGQRIKTGVLASGAVGLPRVVVAGNLFVFTYYSETTTQLFLGTLPVSTPHATVAFTAITADSGTTASRMRTTKPLYDVLVAQDVNSLYLAFPNQLDGTTLRRYATTNLSTLAAQVDWTDCAASCVTVFYDRFYRGPVVAFYTGPGASPGQSTVMFRSYTASLLDGNGDPAVIAAGGVVTYASSQDVVSVTGVSLSADELSLRFYYTLTDANERYDGVLTAGIDGDYHLTTLSMGLGVYTSIIEITSPSETFRPQVRLAAKAFTFDDVAYVPAVHSSALQPTVFLFDENKNIVVKALPGVAGRRSTADSRVTTAYPTVPSTSLVGESAFRFAALERSSIVSSDVVGLVTLGIDFSDRTRAFLSAEMADSLHVGGGMLWQYDGVSPVEHGFHLYPEDVSASADVGGSDLSYQYVAVYEWTDNNGYKHLSAPSPAVTVATATGTPIGGGDTVFILIPRLFLTAKGEQAQVPRGDIVIGLYRTAANESVFRRVGQVSNAGVPVFAGYEDSMTDADLQDEEVLYTTGGVVENIAPPPTNLVTTHRNRVVVRDSTSPLLLWYSKQVTPGAPVEFSDLFTLQVDPRGGDVTALASLDDKLIVFKRSSIFYITGQGPDVLGQNNDLSDALLVTTDCGCVNPRSVFVVPQGIVFQSTKGIYLLDRGLAVSYIGAEVESFNGDTVTGGALVEDANQIRFTLDSGVALVFDYFVSNWSVFTPVRAVDALVWRGNFTYLRADGTALVETPGVYTDNGSHIRLRVVTSWLQFAQMQGFQRVYQVLILGEYQSPHNLLVKVAYDFAPAPTQETLVTPTAPGTYGSGSPYGSDSVYGGTFDLYQWLVYFARQKCQAIQISLEDVPDGTPGQGMSLSGLTFVVGTKQGTNKLSDAKAFG